MESYDISARIKFTLDQEALRRIVQASDDVFVRWYSHIEIIGEAKSDDYFRHFALGGTLRFCGKAGLGDHDLTHENFIRGLHLYLEKDFPEEIIYGRGIDNGLTDEFVAYDIVQYALFGRLLRESHE